MSATPRVLHVAAEAHPLIKTGGLADVVGALPGALAATGCDARLLLPAYGEVLAKLAVHGELQPLGAPLGTAFGASYIQLLRARLPGTEVPLYVIAAPWLYERVGHPARSRSHPLFNQPKFHIRKRPARAVGTGVY